MPEKKRPASVARRAGRFRFRGDDYFFFAISDSTTMSST